MTTILDVDLGNSALKFRCGVQRGRVDYAPTRGVGVPAVVLPDLSGVDEVHRVRVASVLSPEQDAEFARLVASRWGCQCEFARSVAETAGVRNGYLKPETLGVDRWLALVAGFTQAQGAVLVVDLGTAVTLDYVDVTGQHLGGFIVPGSALMVQSLLSETAAIKFADGAELDNLNPGRETRDAVERGALLGLVQLIDGELERLSQLCHHNARSAAGAFEAGNSPEKQDSQLLLCGGGADAVVPHLKSPFVLVPELVLDGLALVLP